MSKHKHKKSPSSQRQESQQMILPGTTPGELWRQEFIYTGDLYSGQPYQRPVKDPVVNKLVREWDPRLLNPLVVSYRDGRYYLVDGQHRLCVMRKKNDGKDLLALCHVYQGLTYEQEAELYYKLELGKGHLSLAHATKALLEAGCDVEIIEVNRLLEEAGFVWALDKHTGEPFEIRATRAVINAYKLLGGAAFSRMLLLLAKSWRGAPASLRASMLSGMALFVKTYEAEFDDAIFIRRMSAVDMDEIIRRSMVDFSTSSSALRFARVIWDKYNNNGKGRWGSQLPYRFKH